MNWELLKPRNAIVIVIIALIAVYLADRFAENYIR